MKKNIQKLFMRLFGLNNIILKLDNETQEIKQNLKRLENLIMANIVQNIDDGISKERIFNILNNYNLSCDFSLETYKLAERIFYLLRPCDVVNAEKIRLGGDNDGGYVMVNPGKATENKVAYSFGISSYDPWSLDMAYRNFPVFQYDGTVDKSPDKHPLVHFYKYMITGSQIPKTTEKNFKQIISDLGHQNKDIILQCDIEGAEWDFFDSLTEEDINHFEQISVELHNLAFSGKELTKHFRVLEKLNQSHQCIHVHANNCGRGLILQNLKILPDILEVCYVRKINPHNKQADYKFADCTEEFPTNLDAPCIADLPDIYLGYIGIKENTI